MTAQTRNLNTRTLSATMNCCPSNVTTLNTIHHQRCRHCCGHGPRTKMSRRHRNAWQLRCPAQASGQRTLVHLRKKVCRDHRKLICLHRRWTDRDGEGGGASHERNALYGSNSSKDIRRNSRDSENHKCYSQARESRPDLLCFHCNHQAASCGCRAAPAVLVYAGPSDCGIRQNFHHCCLRTPGVHLVVVPSSRRFDGLNRGASACMDHRLLVLGWQKEETSGWLKQLCRREKSVGVFICFSSS